MSYEGYEQHICANGHLFNTDSDFSGMFGDEENPRNKCPYCEEKSVWYNCVDDTNCESVGVICDFSSLMLTPMKSQTCNLGHTHVIEEPTYRVPTDEEKNALQCFFDQKTMAFKPLTEY